MTDKIQNLIKASKILEHNKQPKIAMKKKSLIECGIDKKAVDFLVNLRKGPLTTITMYLDDDPEGDCGISFRLLTAQEGLDLELEMDKLTKDYGFTYLSVAYNIYYASKLLAKASKLSPSTNEVAEITQNQPVLTEEALRNAIDTDTLIALGRKYMEFRDTYSPKLEEVTQEQIDEVVAELDVCEDSPEKKLLCLNGLNSRWIERIVLLDIHEQLRAQQKQVAKSFIG